MIINLENYKTLFHSRFIEIYDRDWNLIPDLVSVDTQTGKGIQMKRDNNRFVIEGGHVVKEEVQITLPVRVVPIRKYDV